MRTGAAAAACLCTLAAFVWAIHAPSAGLDPVPRMAVTIDDLPVAQPSWHSDRRMSETVDRLLATLTEHRVPAVGFVNESKLEVDGTVDPFRVVLLRRWLEAGIELGNHAYALNADWLDGLLTDLEARGYRWISLEEALRDPVYARPIDGYTGPGGITWLHRWAISEGLDSSIFAGEPEPPDWVSEGSH